MPVGHIKLDGYDGAGALAFFRRYSIEENLRNLIGDFMPIIFEVKDGYGISSDGRKYANIDEDNYSFYVERYKDLHQCNFWVQFNRAVDDQCFKAKSNINTRIRNSLGKESLYLKLLYEECNSFLADVDKSLLHKKFPFFKDTILSLINYLEYNHPSYCPSRKRYIFLQGEVVPILLQNERLDPEKDNWVELDIMINSYYQDDHKKYSVTTGNLTTFLFQVCTGKATFSPFGLTIKPIKNLFYLISQLHVKVAKINYHALDNANGVTINNKAFSMKYIDSYPSMAEAKFKTVINTWISTLKK